MKAMYVIRDWLMMTLCLLIIAVCPDPTDYDPTGRPMKGQ